MAITLELTDEQARDVIRATSVYARDLAAGMWRDKNLTEIKRVDALRHEVEAAVDKAA